MLNYRKILQNVTAIKSKPMINQQSSLFAIIYLPSKSASEHKHSCNANNNFRIIDIFRFFKSWFTRTSTASSVERLLYSIIVEQCCCELKSTDHNKVK